MDKQHSIDEIAEQVEGQKRSQLPPVDKWDPDFSGDIDIRINREGQWFHEGSVFKRLALVKLFSSILKREGDEYFLVTPVEKFRIQVDDLPFVVTKLEISKGEDGMHLTFTTNVDEQIIADADHPIVVDYQAGSDEPQPRIRVRRNLYARIHRNVFYELVDLAEEEETTEGRQLVVKVAGQVFVLGRL